MIDCIASYHLNPWTCGIAKFNLRLADALHVPLVTVVGLPHSRYTHPLVSVNPSEFAAFDRAPLAVSYDLLLHGFDPSDPFAVTLAQRAGRVWAGNEVLTSVIRPSRRDVRTVWCPSTIPAYRAETPEIQVLTFGMAHKLDAARYGRLRNLLEGSGRTYRLNVSTALHERTPWEDTLPVLETEMQAIFGSKVHLLGNLSDAGMAQALHDATAMAAFFPDGVRANNTTVWAALEHGCPVITNLDSHSPKPFVHGATVFDVDRLETWPTAASLRDVQVHAWEMCSAYSWKELVKVLVA